jgi:ERCC4-type nuclease
LIIVDRFEPKALEKLIQKKMAGMGGVERRPLSTGDYCFQSCDGEMVLIERKSVNDLYGSFAKGRLQDQLSRCIVEAPGHAYLLIEGPLKEQHGFLVTGTGKKMKSPYTALSNFLVTAQNEGVMVLLSPNIEMSASVIVALYEYYQRRGHMSMRELGKMGRYRKKDLAYAAQVAFLMGLPGMGEKLAQEALRVYGSPFLALQDSFNKVKGVGPVKRKALVDIIFSRKDCGNESDSSK